MEDEMCCNCGAAEAEVRTPGGDDLCLECVRNHGVDEDTCERID